MDWLLLIAGACVGAACLAVIAARMLRPQPRPARRRLLARPA